MKNRLRQNHKRRPRMQATRVSRKSGPPASQQQIFPDEYIAWLTVTNQGDIAAGSSTGVYTVNLNDCVHPFNTTAPFPNLVNSSASWDPTGLENILYNTGTSSGIYYFYRVLAVKFEISFQPTTITDVMDVAMAPAQNGGIYGSFATTASGPQGKKMVCTTNNNTRMNTLRAQYDVAKIMGITQFTGGIFTATTDGQFSTPPVNAVVAYVAWYTRVNLSTPVQYWVSMKFKVKFFGRVDAPLLESLRRVPRPPTKSIEPSRVEPLNQNNCNNVVIKEDYVDVDIKEYPNMKYIQKCHEAEVLKNKLLALTSNAK